MINGIIEFDQKMQSLLPGLILINDRQWLISKTNWNYILISMFIYFIGFEILETYVWPPMRIDIYIITVYFFSKPYITDYVVFITVFFFLVNIGYRFQTINSFWKCLPDGLIAIPGKCTHHEIVLWIEDIRILHARLSEILKLFNLGYGLLLLHFFVFNFIDLIYTFYIVVKHEFLVSNERFIDIIVRFLPTHLYKLQIVVFMMSMVVASSWIIEKKKKIISYLRLIRISNLPVDIKNQIKMFMIQLSISEWDEISAFGFFNVNLNLVVSILILLITGITTLIQMKNHPIVLELFNNTVLRIEDWGRN